LHEQFGPRLLKIGGQRRGVDRHIRRCQLTGLSRGDHVGEPGDLGVLQRK
jgi:hypothetical protein